LPKSALKLSCAAPPEEYEVVETVPVALDRLPIVPDGTPLPLALPNLTSALPNDGVVASGAEIDTVQSFAAFWVQFSPDYA
jgi:hypothetical protein